MFFDDGYYSILLFSGDKAGGIWKIPLPKILKDI